MATPQTRSAIQFFLLVFALSLPLWVLGAVTGLQLLPNLPVSALMSVCPLLAASLLVYGEGKIAGVTELLKRAIDYRRIQPRAWCLLILLISPAIAILTYVLMKAMALPLPIPHIPWLMALLLFPPFMILALTEEVGWLGYAIDPMQQRWNALTAAIVLGLVWVVWHVIPLMQAHRAVSWIAWWALGTVASRVLIVWIYNNTGKNVFAGALYHASSNLSWILFPNFGSNYNPRITSLLLAFAATAVTVVWGPRTLAGYRC